MFSKTRIRFNELLEDAKSYFVGMYGQIGRMFTPATAWGQILHAITQLSDLIFYYIEDSITELNIRTASRTDSIRGIAALTGHDSIRSIAASGDLFLQWNGSVSTLKGDEVIIPNFTKILCINNGLPYILDLNKDEIRVKTTSGQTPTRIKVRQGEIGISTFTGTNLPIQSFEVTGKTGRFIDQYFFNVYVNGKLWKKYESLYDMPLDAEGYLAKTGIISGIDIIFGNGYMGKMPTQGSEIRVEYLLNDGEGGNIREANKVQWQWVDTGYDILGNEVNLNETLKTESGAVEFGSNAEPIEVTRLLAPKQSKSFVLANPDNYYYYFAKWNYFSQIHAYRKANDLDLTDDNIIYLFLIPDIKKRIYSEENYFTIPQEMFRLTEDERDRIWNSIEDSGSKVVGTEIQIVEPIFSKYVVNISLVIYEGHNEQGIISEIISRLSDWWLSIKRKDRIPKSDLISIIETVSGVDSVSMFFICEKNEADKKLNPDSTTDIGLDSWGDIIIAQNELVLLRGGWEDRSGIFYEDSASREKPSSINIEIREIIKEDISLILNKENKNLIR